MKKKNLIMSLVVGAMVGTMLVGCGDKVEPTVETVVETQQDGVETTEESTTESATVEAETAETTVEEATTEEVTEEPAEEFVDDGTFYGFEIAPSGVETYFGSWGSIMEDGTVRYLGGGDVFPEDGGYEGAIQADVETVDNGDGTITKTVTYTNKFGGWGGDFVVAVFDYKTHEDLTARDDVTASLSECTWINDKDWTFTATVTAPSECDPVFVFTQDFTALDNYTYWDVSELKKTGADFAKFVETNEQYEGAVASSILISR